MIMSEAKPASIDVTREFVRRAEGNDRHIYRVTRATNTFVVELEDKLSRETIEALISTGVTVNIT